MSWFDPSALSKYSSYAKTALKTAQKNIDKVLEISDHVGDDNSAASTTKVLSGQEHIRPKQNETLEQETTPKSTDHERVNSRSPSRQSSVTSDGEQTSPSSPSSLGDSFFSSFLNSSTPKRSSPESSSKPSEDKSLTNIDDEPSVSASSIKDSSTQQDDDFQTPPSKLLIAKALSTSDESAILELENQSKSSNDDEFFTPVKKPAIGPYSTHTQKEDSPSETKRPSPLDENEPLVLNHCGSETNENKELNESFLGNNTEDRESKDATLNNTDLDNDKEDRLEECITDKELKFETEEDVSNDTNSSVESEAADHQQDLIVETIDKRTSQTPVSICETELVDVNDSDGIKNIGINSIDSENIEKDLSDEKEFGESDSEIEATSKNIENEKLRDETIPGADDSGESNQIIEENLRVATFTTTKEDVETMAHSDDSGNTSTKEEEYLRVASTEDSGENEEHLRVKEEAFVETMGDSKYSDTSKDNDRILDKGLDSVDRAQKLENLDADISNSTPISSLAKVSEKSHGSTDVVTNDLEKELRRVQKLLEAREEQLIEYSKQNISYQESNAIYQNQLEQMENMRATEDTEMEQLRKEFTGRISESESKLKSVIRERDQLKLSLEETQTHLKQSADQQITSLTNSLIEKEERVKDLLEEGEALSKKELDSNNKIKKFRVKLKEVNAKNEISTKKIEEQEAKIETLKISLSEKENHSKEIDDERQKLERMTDSQEDEITILKEKFDDLFEQHEATETTLKSAYMEIDKLNLEKAQQISEVNEANASAEKQSELERRLKELEKQSKYGKEELQEQLLDLQAEYSRLEQQSARKEENFKREIQDLHKRIEDGESRNQELSQSVTAVTKPLLRQIENLQHSHSSQSENWERIERNLTERVGQLQQEMLLSSEKERSATDIAQEMKSKVKSLDIQMKTLKSEKKKLEAALEEETTSNKEKEEFVQKHKNTTEKQLKKLKLRYEDIVKERTFLEEQLSTEKMKYETDILQLNAKLTSQQEQYTMQQSLNRSSNNSRRNSASSVQLDDHEISSFTNEVERPSLIKRHQRNLSSTSSLNGSLLSDYSMNTATAESMERLQRQLKRRDGEVYILQEEVKTLEKTKASLAQELVNLSNRIELLESDSKELIDLRVSYKDLESRYGAVLQMYGEKEEETEELKMDLQDIRNMYKQQIQQLLGGS